MNPVSPDAPPSQNQTRTFRETVDLEQFELCLRRLEERRSRIGGKPDFAEKVGRLQRGATREQRKKYAHRLKLWRKAIARYNDVTKGLKMLRTMKEHGERNDAECTLSYDVA